MKGAFSPVYSPMILHARDLYTKSANSVHVPGACHMVRWGGHDDSIMHIRPSAEVTLAMKRLKWLWPSGLRNRLFVSFLLLVLVPSTVLQIRNISQMETLMKTNISQQNMTQLETMKSNLENLKIEILGTMLKLEREPETKDRLLNPDRYDAEERELFIQNKLLATKHGLTNASLPVHYTLVDGFGHVYSTMNEIHAKRQAVPAAHILQQPSFSKLAGSDSSYFWEVFGPEDLLGQHFPGSTFYSLLSKLESVDGTSFAYLRISLDLKAWMASITNAFQVKQTYYLTSADGRPVLESDEGPGEGLFHHMLSTLQTDPAGYLEDGDNLYIYNGIFLPNSGWYLINRFPLEALSGDIQSMKNRVLVSFLFIAVLFIGVTFAIVSTVVRPLRRFQRNMSELVERNLDVRIPEQKYKGEIFFLARAFNKMTDDIRGLIARLKTEERQKEAIRFQMLMSQMNPHFLLNTLNTIKWNARNHGDTGTSEICQNLGKLLEHSLNAEVDLVHLKEELELVRAYAYIQSFRYDHSFVLEYDIGEGLEYALVPKLSLQPLVENAIYHGLVHMKAGGKIVVRVRNVDGMLRLEVQDNGQGLTGPEQGKAIPVRKRKGIGLGNLRERLALLYKGEAQLLLLPLESGALARLNIPLLVSSPYDRGDPHVEDPFG